MANLSWYWHRLKAMGPGEILGHLRKKGRQTADRYGPRRWSRVPPGTGGTYPRLPAAGEAPASVREALRRDADRLRSGRWTAFGHLELVVDDPPRWHKDYLAGIDLTTRESGFRLDHRQLPGGADIKLIWELSRWQPLTRLAMAARIHRDAAAAETCASWLEDWVRINPPFRGWNWTSALESGMRLIQFAWIDALLFDDGEAPVDAARWEALRRAMLPAHVWFTSRYRSFGSSANNHLLGELAGLIVAVVRWPRLRELGVALDHLRRAWEDEVMRQFAADGGNREQALNYQLFSWELCWQARQALRAAGQPVASAVEQRLSRAADFYAAVQVDSEVWDYGDSDGACVLPFMAREDRAAREWQTWFNDPAASPSLRYWMREPPAPAKPPACQIGAGDWLVYPDSGIAVCWSGDWNLRWDGSPLGYLATAAHGHLDALHLSLWYRDVAFVVDPGTGAYYGDLKLREHLASWEAHNGPHPAGTAFPERQGPFLWRDHHAPPRLGIDSDRSMLGQLDLPAGRVRRVVRRMEDEDGWQVDDDFEAVGGEANTAFTVRWQFAPGTELEQLEERIFQIRRRGQTLRVGVDAAWKSADMIRPGERETGHPVSGDLTGICSPSFRRVAWGPQLKLTAPGHNPCLFRTTFLASRDS